MATRLHLPKQTTIVTLGLLVLVGITGSLGWRPAAGRGTSFANAPDKSWVQPAHSALNNSGPVSDPSLRNYDCTKLNYRLIDDVTKTMHEGCFVRTAYGMLEPDAGLILFNSSDEAEPIKSGSSTPALNAMPYSASTARFGGFPVQGTYMYVYSYFPNNLQTSRDLHLHRFKELTGNPTFTVSDSSGQPLAVNPQAFAYAGRGQWFVTESPGHSLVRVNSATFSVLPFAQSYDIVGKPYASHQASLAITEDGRYAAAASTEFRNFKVYDLATCGVGNSTDPLAPQTCRSHDYWPYVASQVAGDLQSIKHVQFVDDGIVSFEATTNLGTESYLLSPDGPITSLIPYLGLGDSFASGQGAFNYISGTDTILNHCHLSAHSYPLLLSADLFANRGHSVACSGAQIHDIGNQSAGYTGQSSDQRSAQDREADGSDIAIKHDFSAGYLAQQEFVTSYRPGVVTIEVGGNDVGFKDILLRCMSPLIRSKHSVLNSNNCYDSYEERLEVMQAIDRTYPKWLQLYRSLQNRSPASQIYAIGYPQVISANNKCGLNVHLTPEDINFARDVTAYINATIQKAARAATVHYVEIGDALRGVELCSGVPPAVNGLTAGNDIYGIIGQESFHPNAHGQELIEQAILRATNNFTAPASSEPTATDGNMLAGRQPTGQPIRTVVPDDKLTAGSASPGTSMSVTLDSARDGLAANSSYSVAVGNTAVGTGTTEGQGSGGSTITVPITTNPGTQPVTVTGTNNDGNPVTIITVIYIPETNTDYDGDGIPNSQDSCPLIVNSGIDQDNDGLDDACDQSITVTVTPNPPAVVPTDGGSSNPTPPSTPVTPPTPVGQPATPPSENPVQPSTPIAIVQPTDSANPAGPVTVAQNAPDITTTATYTTLQVRETVTAAKPAVRTAPKTVRLQSVGYSSRVAVVSPGPSQQRAQLVRPPLPRYAWYVWLLALVVLLTIVYGCRVGLRRREE